MTEKEIEALLVQRPVLARRRGARLRPIVAAGDNSARPMPMPAPTTPSSRATRCCSTSARVSGGFCADITRTVFVGHATDEAQDGL